MKNTEPESLIKAIRAPALWIVLGALVALAFVLAVQP